MEDKKNSDGVFSPIFGNDQIKIINPGIKVDLLKQENVVVVHKEGSNLASDNGKMMNNNLYVNPGLNMPAPTTDNSVKAEKKVEPKSKASESVLQAYINKELAMRKAEYNRYKQEQTGEIKVSANDGVMNEEALTNQTASFERSHHWFNKNKNKKTSN